MRFPFQNSDFPFSSVKVCQRVLITWNKYQHLRADFSRSEASIPVFGFEVMGENAVVDPVGRTSDGITYFQTIHFKPEKKWLKQKNQWGCKQSKAGLSPWHTALNKHLQVIYRSSIHQVICMESVRELWEIYGKYCVWWHCVHILYLFYVWYKALAFSIQPVHHQLVHKVVNPRKSSRFVAGEITRG